MLSLYRLLNLLADKWGMLTLSSRILLEFFKLYGLSLEHLLHQRNSPLLPHMLKLLHLRPDQWKLPDLSPRNPLEFHKM